MKRIEATAPHRRRNPAEAEIDQLLPSGPRRNEKDVVAFRHGGERERPRKL